MYQYIITDLLEHVLPENLKYRHTRGDQKVRRKLFAFLHPLINRVGITAHNTATHMQLIGYNMLNVNRLRALQLSSRQAS